MKNTVFPSHDALEHYEERPSASMDVITETSSTEFIPRRLKPDIEVLEKHYSLVPGSVISMTLQEALSLMERDYPKTEAFLGLTHWLKRHRNVELIITSRYHQKQEKGGSDVAE